MSQHHPREGGWNESEIGGKTFYKRQMDAKEPNEKETMIWLRKSAWRGLAGGQAER